MTLLSIPPFLARYSDDWVYAAIRWPLPTIAQVNYGERQREGRSMDKLEQGKNGRTRETRASRGRKTHFDAETLRMVRQNGDFVRVKVDAGRRAPAQRQRGPEPRRYKELTGSYRS